MVITWVVGLLTVAGIGLFGQRPAPPDAIAAVPSGARPHDAQRVMLAPALVPLTSDRLTMTRPYARNAPVHTQTVEVAGAVGGGVGDARAGGRDVDRVVVTLESRRSHLLESRTLSVAADGRFTTSFPLPNPRPGGRMRVTIVLIADNGLPIEAIRRPFVSGPLTQTNFGQDGLISGMGTR
jgi:hypothetical protein